MDDSVVQPPAPPPQTVQIPPSPPPRRNYSVILIVILVILLGILVGMELDETTLIANFRSRFLRPTPTPTVLVTPTPTCRPRPACLDATPRCLIPETSDMCPKASPSPFPTGQKVMGIQISTCCSCPKMVDSSVIGTNGWVLYEQGKDYSSQITANCTNIQCSPCPPLQQTNYICPPNGYVDCQPILTPEKQAACSREAMAWYTANCPDFKGGAL